MKIGVISDTHGLLRPEALEALRGSEVIVHAGDIGKLDVLQRLREIAPVYAVRGNMDRGHWADSLPVSEVVEVEGLFLYALHDLNELDLDQRAAGFRAVIFGHSHKPHLEERQGILFLNPGSAGPKRFKLPVSLASIELKGGALQARLIMLDV